MLVSDGVFPSNEARGFVLRRIIRRAIRHAYLLGVEKPVMPSLVDTAVEVMGYAYPDVVTNHDFIAGVLAREEERFRTTLRTGLSILEDEIAASPERLSGSTTFLLHDTYGFPLELTEEIAGERGVAVDREGFDVEMAEQRRRARDARKGAGVDSERQDRYREISEQFGLTEFVGYHDDAATAHVLAVEPGDDGTVEIFLDRTPFYAESGGQVGDTGTISTETGRADVIDTTFAVPGVRRHVARLVDGEISIGQTAEATIDSRRRAAIRRNHTGTHVLHHALRQVLGDHVKQAGSLVGPDRLRFDFNHYAALTDEEITRIEEVANAETLANTPVRSVRDDQGGGRLARRDRVLRRQVRRHRPRPRGRQLRRAVRWYTRARAPATSAWSRSSPRARSDRTCGASRPRPVPTRWPCCSATSTC